jgi:uncharacterized membrane protein
MSRDELPLRPYRPELGCALMLLALLFLCVLPYFFVNAMQLALAKLHLSAAMATLCIGGIFLGSLVNIPIRRLERQQDQVILVRGWHGWISQVPFVRRSTTQTVLAINFGGGVVPLLLALYQLTWLLGQGSYVLGTLTVIVLLNVLACFFAARPIEGVGIGMPPLLSPGVAVVLSWVLLMSPEYNAARPPLAFIAGVLGPLVGADLHHLRDIQKISAGVLSIGGAGTFDGIVLSGMLAAILA